MFHVEHLKWFILVLTSTLIVVLTDDARDLPLWWRIIFTSVFLLILCHHWACLSRVDDAYYSKYPDQYRWWKWYS